MKSSAGAEVVLLAAPVVERAGAAADAAEVEAQHRAADARQRLGGLIHHLGVHRAAVLRMRMREHDGRARLGAAPAASSSASSGPAGPAISRRSVDCRRHVTKLADDRGKPSGLRDDAEVAGALEHRRTGAPRIERQVLARHSTGTTRSSRRSPVTTSVGAVIARAVGARSPCACAARDPRAPCATAISGAASTARSCVARRTAAARASDGIADARSPARRRTGASSTNSGRRAAAARAGSAAAAASAASPARGADDEHQRR